jgi:site-specific DNA-methyltransferase (adenine-specific)/modification methylase
MENIINTEKYKLICGNCLDVMKTIPDKQVDLVLTSPPYNMRTRICNGKYTTREKSEHFSKKYSEFHDALPIDKFYEFHKACLLEMLRISKVVAYNFQIVTGSKEAFFKLIGDFNKDIKDIIVWDKGFGQPAMHEKVLNSAYELILILENDKKAGRVIQNAIFDRGTMQNILRINRGTSKIKGHAAVFPEKLVESIILNFSKENDTVLDPFMGSETTGVVCKKLNRGFIGVELCEKYYNDAKERIERVD